MIITKEKYKGTCIVYIDERRIDANACATLKEDYDNSDIPLHLLFARMTRLREREPIYP